MVSIVFSEKKNVHSVMNIRLPKAKPKMIKHYYEMCNINSPVSSVDKPKCEHQSHDLALLIIIGIINYYWNLTYLLLYFYYSCTY